MTEYALGYEGGWEENETSKNAQGGTETTKRKLQAELPRELLSHFQIVPSRVRGLQNEKIRIYHAHDNVNDPETEFFKNKNDIDKFHKIVFSSNWQYQQYQNFYGLPYNSKNVVIDTWIIPAPHDVLNNKPKNQINLFYASTPQRGLEVLVPVFEKLAEKYNDIHLHVHSSFLIYGWKEMDEKYEPLYEKIRNHPQMTYHGFMSHSEVMNAVNNYHILAFPSIWLETSCRVLMEAMSAGCLCVHPNLGALPDTSGGLTWMFPGDVTNLNQHAQNFYETLDMAIQKTKAEIDQGYVSFNLQQAKDYADVRFGFETIKQRWLVLLENLLKAHPTVETRAGATVPNFYYSVGPK